MVHGSRSIGTPSKWVYAAQSAALLLAVSACAPPDAPPGLSSRVPDGVTSLLRPDTVRSARLGPGVLYRYLWSPEGPWAVHVVEAALDRRCDLTLDVLRAGDREDGGEGFESVSSMVARSGRSVLAAVNADFFTPEGRPTGPEVVDGVVTSRSSRPALSWREGSPPWVGSPGRSGSTLDLGWAVPLDGGDGITEALGGFPELLAEGERVGDLAVGDLPSFAASRHPRTAVGYDSESGRFWMIAVDGRQPPHSSGMTLPELTSLLEALGADEALNLDGGGSTVLIVRGRPVSRPSDEDGERSVVNALALRRDPSACEVSARR